MKYITTFARPPVRPTAHPVASQEKLSIRPPARPVLPARPPSACLKLAYNAYQYGYVYTYTDMDIYIYIYSMYIHVHIGICIYVYVIYKHHPGLRAFLGPGFVHAAVPPTQAHQGPGGARKGPA